MHGVEEGVYAWVAVNYVAGRFAHGAQLAERLGPPGEAAQHLLWPGWDSVGTLDLGGSSLQVAYVLPPQSGNGSTPEAGVHQMRLGGGPCTSLEP